MRSRIRPLPRRHAFESLEARRLLATTVTSTLAPLADAYVRDGASAAANFGTAPDLVVKGSPTLGNTRRTYLKFDLGALADVDAVTLRLRGSAGAASPGVNLAAFGVADTGWGETTVNWNNKPALTGAALSTRLLSGTADTWYAWDVSAYVRAELAAGRATVSLAVEPANKSTANPTATFDAREGADDPQLVVTTTTDDEPPPPPPAAAALRIDSAGGPKTDSAGNVFAKDAGFVGGSANTNTFAVSGTTDDALYSTRRTGTFAYANAVPNGDYTLRLLFADYYTSAGQRKFNVNVEGQRVLTNFDIVAEAGPKAALVKSFPVSVADGKLDLSFQAVANYASLSAFELLPVAPAGSTVSVGDASAGEGNAGTTPFTFAVTRGGDTSGPATVQYATSNGTAGDGDYIATTGTVSFAAGEKSKTVTVDVTADTVAEADETFFVTLSDADGVTIADGEGRGTIVDDDAVANTTWTRSAPRSPVPRTEAGVIQIGSKVYSIGGFTAEGGGPSFFPLTRRVHVYNMATRAWSELAPLPAAAAGNHMGVATDGTYIYTVAGQVEDTYGAGTDTAWRYHIATDAWSPFVSLPEVRFGGVAFVADGWLHYAGGDAADRETPTTDHWAIDLANPDADGWVRRADVPQPGDHASHATINGKVYVFGGEHGHHGIEAGDENGYVQHNYTFEYDPVTDAWATKANMPLALSHVEGSTLVVNGQAVLIGGLLTGGGSNTTNRVHVYDPVLNSWRTLTTLFPKRVIGAAGGYWNGKVYLSDGYSPDESDRSVGFEGTLLFNQRPLAWRGRLARAPVRG